MKAIITGLLLLVVHITYFSSAFAAGKPFDDLQNQIDVLQNQLDELQATIDNLQPSNHPVEVSVNCSTDTITSVLNKYQHTPAPLTIYISGQCQEAVNISRNDVALRGPGSIRSIGDQDAITITGASGIILDSLSILGSIYPNGFSSNIGVNCTNNTNAFLNNLNIAGFGAGISSSQYSYCSVNHSTISGGSVGIGVISSSLRAVSVNIIGNEVGVAVERNADVLFGRRVDRGDGTRSPDTSPQSIISDNDFAGFYVVNGILNLRNTAVQNNTTGIHVGDLGLVEARRTGAGPSFVNINNNGTGISCSGLFDFGTLSRIEFSGNSLDYVLTCENPPLNL